MVAVEIRRDHTLTDWMAWDHEVHAAVLAFRRETGATPNLLLAAESTYRRIEMAMDRRNVRDADGAGPAPGEYADLAFFSGPDYVLDFCVEAALPTGAYVLVHDPDPGAEESVDESEEAVEMEPRRAAG